MSKQVNYNENLCAGAAIRDDKGRRISKLFEASHPKMTVGYAKNLIMPDDPTEQEFNFRQAGGGVIEDGVAVIDKVKGNSVVWNQRVNYIAPQVSGDTANLTCTREADGRYKIVLSAQVTELTNIIFAPIVSTGVRAGHKYMSKYGESDNLAPHIGYSNGNGVWWQWTPTDFAHLDSIATPSETTDLYGTLYVGSALPAGTYYFLPTLFDLTQMFGAGNEPTTYEEFLQRKPKVADEYAYNEGTIVNNKVEGCRTVGFNQFNPNVETEYLAVTGKSGTERYVKRFKALPGTYFIKSINNESVYVKSVINGVYGSASSLSGNVTITLDSYGEIWVYSETEAKINGVANDICINLSDPAINGKYFPYEEHTLDLSWVKEIKDGEGVKLFEDGMRSAGTAFDEVGKNKAVKRVGVKVYSMSEVSAAPNTYSNITYFRLPKPNDSASKGSIQKQHSTSKYPYNSNNTGWDNANFIGQFFDSADYNFYWVGFAKGTTLEQAKEAIDGLVVNYELAEPIEVEYDEKNLTYPVVAGGTEEAIVSEPSSSFRADIGYGIDAVKTILDLKARVEALEKK